jgi:hypothetical protein
MDDGRYHVELAAAFVRGRLPHATGTPEELIEQGLAHGLRLHKFKRDSELPRVRVVLGALRGIAPASALWRQNRDREDMVPASTVRALMGRWEVPDLTEAHEVVWMLELR